MSKELERAFRERALRCTPQRYSVLQFLTRSPLHATAEEIFQAVNRGDPRASRATVYNCLRDLTRAGLVREIALEGKAARFDASLHKHHHFVCAACGSVEDIPWFELPRGAGKAALGDRVVNNYEIVFRGVCERCAKREKAEAG